MNRRCEVVLAHIRLQAYLLKRMFLMRTPMQEAFVGYNTEDKTVYIAATTGSIFDGTLKVEEIFYDARPKEKKPQVTTKTFSIRPGDWELHGSCPALHYAYTWTAPQEWLDAGFDARKAAFDPAPAVLISPREFAFVASRAQNLTVCIHW